MIIDAQRLTGDLQPYLEDLIEMHKSLESERYYEEHGEDYQGTLVHRSMKDMMAEVARDMPRFLGFVYPSVFGGAAPVKVRSASHEGYAYPVELLIDETGLQHLARFMLGNSYCQPDTLTVIEDLIQSEVVLMGEEFTSWFYLLGNAVYTTDKEV